MWHFNSKTDGGSASLQPTSEWSAKSPNARDSPCKHMSIAEFVHPKINQKTNHLRGRVHIGIPILLSILTFCSHAWNAWNTSVGFVLGLQSWFWRPGFTSLQMLGIGELGGRFGGIKVADFGLDPPPLPGVFKKGGYIFLVFFFLVLSVWGIFPCYLQHFGAKIYDLRPTYYLLHFVATISHLHAHFAFGFRLLASLGSWLHLAFGSWFLVFGFGFGFTWLLAFGCWLCLAFGFCWLLVFSFTWLLCLMRTSVETMCSIVVCIL